MPNQYINKVVLADNTVLLDVSADTVTAETLLIGITAHGANGAQITGTILDGDALYYGHAAVIGTATIGDAVICEEDE